MKTTKNIIKIKIIRHSCFCCTNSWFNVTHGTLILVENVYTKITEKGDIFKCVNEKLYVKKGEDNNEQRRSFSNNY